MAKKQITITIDNNNVSAGFDGEPSMIEVLGAADWLRFQALTQMRSADEKADKEEAPDANQS